jgi:hypothetical protein
MRSVTLLALSLIILAGCLPARPVLYPNDRMRRVGGIKADRDIDECMQRAEDYLNRRRRGEVVVEETITGVAGVPGGIILDPVDRRNLTPVYQEYVNRCLRAKGYEPLAWN